MKKIYTSIDIGSDTIKFVVGELFNGKINVLASHTIKSKGIRKGLIFDPNLAINAIKDGIKEINEYLGFEIKKVIVNVPDYNSNFMYVSGSIKIENEEEVVTNYEINKVIKDAVYSKLALDYELVTVLPISFSVDEEEGIKNALGKHGKVLGIKAIMISAPKKNVYSVVSACEGAGLEVVDITFSGISDYYKVRNSNLDKRVGAIINLGHETTNVSVINRGILMNTETLPLGGLNIEKDLAYIFHISVFDARVLKEKFASSHKRFCQLTDTFEVKNTAGETIKLNQIEVTEVVMSRLIEILEFAKKQISLLTKNEIDYLIVTGGLTEIKSFKNLVFEILGKDVIIYSVDTIGARNNKYVTNLGMINYFCNKMESRGKEFSMIDEQDEILLITSSDDKNNKKTTSMLTGIFNNLVSSKEEKE